MAASINDLLKLLYEAQDFADELERRRSGVRQKVSGMAVLAFVISEVVWKIEVFWRGATVTEEFKDDVESIHVNLKRLVGLPQAEAARELYEPLELLNAAYRLLARIDAIRGGGVRGPRATFGGTEVLKPSPRARAPRFANAALVHAEGDTPLAKDMALKPDAIIVLRLDIGPLSRDSQVDFAKAFPDEKLPKDVDLDVMVSSSDFAVGLNRNRKELSDVAHGRFFLPGNGDPAVTPTGDKYLKFFLLVPTRTGVATGRVGYYYNNILVQSQRLVASVGVERGSFQIDTDFTLSDDLTGFERWPKRPRLSVLTNSNGDGVQQIVLREAGTAPKGATFNFAASNIRNAISKLRTALANRAPVSKERRRVDLEQDLREFAPHGWSLYNQVPGQRPYVFESLMANPAAFTVQILRPTTSSFVMPWAWVYEIPLNSDKFDVCPLVSKWDENRPLVEPDARQCPYGPHRGGVLCPFGFWGFRYAIEQLSSSEATVPSILAPQTFDFVVAETQYEVDLKSLEAHVSAIELTLQENFPGARLREGRNKTGIRELLGKDTPFIYFYCHGERANIADPKTWLGIGKRETITAEEFIGWIVEWLAVDKRRVWDAVRPLVFINACHSLAIYPETLVSYLDAFVGSGRAAGVIGTEVKVYQTLAMDVAQQFFTYLLRRQHTVDSALRAIRMNYLASGNLLGLVYTPYCWADLRIN